MGSARADEVHCNTRLRGRVDAPRAGEDGLRGVKRCHRLYETRTPSPPPGVVVGAAGMRTGPWCWQGDHHIFFADVVALFTDAPSHAAPAATAPRSSCTPSRPPARPPPAAGFSTPLRRRALGLRRRRTLERGSRLARTATGKGRTLTVPGIVERAKATLTTVVALSAAPHVASRTARRRHATSECSAR